MEMRFKLALSVCIALLLIVTAVWYRYQNQVISSDGGFVEQELAVESIDYEEYLLGQLRTGLVASTSPETDSGELTATDLVGRQLFLDFLNMSSKGEATEENILSLANLYEENIVSLRGYEKMGPLELTVVPTTKENLIRYGEAVSEIYLRYQKLVEAETSMVDDSIFSSINPSSKQFASSLDKIFSLEAEEMRKLKVPQTLAETHLELTNNYLARAWFYRAIAEADTDPVLAFAAIASQDKNLAEETALQQKILDELEKYGIL